MQIFKKFSFLPIILILFSCVTDKDAVREIPEYNEALLNKIDMYFMSNKPERVIQLLQNLSDERLTAQERKAESMLLEKLENEIVSGNYYAAAELQRSADTIKLITDYNSDELYLKGITAKIKNKQFVSALAVFYNNFIYKNKYIEITESDAALIIGAAIETANKTILSFFKEHYPQYTEALSAEIETVLSYIPSTEEMISGTVTIWVNRGIRIERGVGYPDRIIGSGFYIDKNGYILTNYHVIESEVNSEYEGYSRLYIRYDQKQEKIPARVVGWDASLDIALLKVEIEPEYTYSFYGYNDYKPGETIYAIGSPGGLEKTITSGIISASGNRRLLPIGDTIQVDVPINSGNSGGPVIDRSGNLVGVVFAGIEQFEGVNFIIPAKWIIKNIPKLYIDGKNEQSWLGLAAHEDNDGLEIVYIMPGSSAFVSGLETGDRIISIDGINVKKITEAQEAVQDRAPGALIMIEVQREEERFTYLLVTEDRDDMPLKKAIELDSRKNLLTPFLGMSVITGDEKIIGQEYIIKKVYRGTTADETGLSVDDPFSIVSWDVEEEYEVLLVGIRIKKKKAGFLETVIQLGNYIDLNTTI